MDGGTGPEVWFYHLQGGQGLERALPTLLERSLARGWRAVVQAKTEERIAALDVSLWTYSEEGFLAHGTAADGDAAMQPIFLTTGTDNPNGARLRVFVESADIAPAFAASDQAYERAILIFDGDDPDDLAAARAQWKTLKDRGLPLSYWQQTAKGWERKA